MKVLVLGADGYLGWATSMHFSQQGHDVVGVDNYLRRHKCLEHDCAPLIDNPNLQARTKIWKSVTGKEIHPRIGDITDYEFLKSVFNELQPDTVIHFAEQPSAPLSMLNHNEATLTLRNNLLGTLNVAYAVRELKPDCHLIKLGTMGEYGTPDIDIEEGWLDVVHNGRKEHFLYPRQAGSLYHTTKIQDTDLLWFYVRTWGLRVTDLMQGPVYGLSTDEADLDEQLLPNFNYDEIFGTVLNRFIAQAVADYPLTIYGSGGQTRGYLNIKDTLQCLYLAATKPPGGPDLRILNQFVETFSVKQLAEIVMRVGQSRGYNAQVNNLDNPRVEKEEHYYNPAHTGLSELGLKPNLLNDDIVNNIFGIVERYKGNINKAAFFRGVNWK